MTSHPSMIHRITASSRYRICGHHREALEPTEIPLPQLEQDLYDAWPDPFEDPLMRQPFDPFGMPGLGPGPGMI